MASHRWHEGSLHDVPGADIKSNLCATRGFSVHQIRVKRTVTIIKDLILVKSRRV
jgi:hypothetical protein